jgi:hypothetical protein
MTLVTTSMTRLIVWTDSLSVFGLCLALDVRAERSVAKLLGQPPKVGLVKQITIVSFSSVGLDFHDCGAEDGIVGQPLT